MARQLLDCAADPALAALHAQPHGQGVVLLHSGRFHPRWAKQSLLARPRAWFRFSADGHSHLSDAAGLPVSPTRPLESRLWRDLRNLLNDPALPGRWFGFFSYDLARLIEPQKLAPHPRPGGAWPLLELAWCPDFETFPAGRSSDSAAAQLAPPVADSHLASNFTRLEYESAIRRVLQYIAAGDVFQVNLAQRFTRGFTGDPRDLFARLARISPAWYGAYLELGTTRAICSTSPELFLRVRDGHVLTRPIKGTRPAGDAHREQLLHSPKDIAELNMIVDLMRNDLGRVCRYGSVRVSEARTIESHPTIHHGVATIEGRLHESKDIVDLLRATLPGGSVTGAPKVRAMQIIDELEPEPRGPYCGAIGFISREELELSIAIRTMLLTRGDPDCPSWDVRFSVGGGIVADSQPGAEYEETLTKAQAMLRALGD